MFLQTTDTFNFLSLTTARDNVSAFVSDKPLDIFYDDKFQLGLLIQNQVSQVGLQKPTSSIRYVPGCMMLFLKITTSFSDRSMTSSNISFPTTEMF